MGVRVCKCYDADNIISLGNKKEISNDLNENNTSEM